MSKSNHKLLFILTGSIALYKIAFVLSALKKQGHEIKIIATSAALKFIGLSTLEGLTSEKIHTDLYESGSNMDHIHLVRWANAIVIAPATANYINKLANGIGDDLATTVMLAHDFAKPVLIFPAMNTKMYNHPATTDSLKKLHTWGMQIFDSASGTLACGETGVGRLLEPDEIIQIISEKLNITNIVKSPAKSECSTKKILISSGGTQEPIDDVRYITNLSSGKTGAFIADQFIENGFDVTYLCAQSAAKPLLNCKQILFTTFSDFNRILIQELNQHYHTFIHAAAISDYSVVHNYKGKISSDQDEINITLKRNPKLINTVKIINPSTKLIGFKLTSTQELKTINDKVNSLFENAKCDYVVQNDFSTLHSGHHIFNLYSSPQTSQNNLTISDLSNELIASVLKENL